MNSNRFKHSESTVANVSTQTVPHPIKRNDNFIGLR